MIEFVIPSINAKKGAFLHTILNSLIVQTSNCWKAHVVFDGHYSYDPTLWTNYPITFSEIPGPNNDVGHTAREIGKNAATAEWIVLTGEDNYYVPIFVQEFVETMKPGINFVYCDMLHNSFNYEYFTSYPAIEKIDIGNFATRVEFAKQIQLQKVYGADGIFAVEYVSKFCKDENIKHISKALYIHN